jgi:RND family efflux transporter MFP subunit
MKKNIYLSVLTVLALLVSCTSTNKAGVEKKDEKPAVKLATVSIRPVEQLQEYTATVEAEVKNNIAPNAPVRIDKILVEVGDRVSKGQRLVEMDAANLRQLKLQLDNQEADYKRIDELYKVGGVSKADWEAAGMSLNVMRTSYENLLENTSLESPINGIVTARNYDNGDMYSGATPVLVVQQIQPVKLLINVSETYFAQLRKGMEVAVSLDVYPNEKFDGKISLVYPTIDTSSRTFPVEVEMTNADSRIRPGMFARVVVDFGTVDRVVVPDLAVIKQVGSGDRYVYVYQNGRVSYKKVELGRRMDTEYELISGVEDQAQVVVAGQARLLDNMEVAVEK